MLASELIHEIQTLINRHGDCRVDVETQYGIDAALSANFSESDQYGDAIVIRAED